MTALVVLGTVALVVLVLWVEGLVRTRYWPPSNRNDRT